MVSGLLVALWLNRADPFPPTLAPAIPPQRGRSKADGAYTTIHASSKH
jgi:hypothetical protein